MNPDLDRFDASDFPDAAPERWETAVEDLAQLVALGLDRAQDLADVINDVFRTRPALAKVVVAGIAGAAVGAFAASCTVRRPKPIAATAAPAAAPPGQPSILDDATSILVEAAEALAKRRLGVTSSAVGGAASTPKPSRSQLRHATDLLPIGLTLLKNPLVRDLVVKSVVRATRRS